MYQQRKDNQQAKVEHHKIDLPKGGYVPQFRFQSECRYRDRDHVGADPGVVVP